MNRNGSNVKFSSRPWLLVNVVQRMIYPRFNVSCLAEQSVQLNHQGFGIFSAEMNNFDMKAIPWEEVKDITKELEGQPKT